MRRFSKGWGYALDYDKAIAGDNAEIEYLSAPAMAALGPLISAKLPEWRAAGWSVDSVDVWGLPALACVLPEVPALLGFEPREFACLALYECTLGANWTIAKAAEITLGIDQSRPSEERRVAWARGKFLSEYWCAFRPLPEEKRIERLRKAKSDLARHTRNRAKFT